MDLESEDESGTTSRVTLSGLLNAIDGVAAPEGHILVMTTNRPFQLDDALVRAGRISVRVEFKAASKRQAEEIFLRMYVDLPSTSPPWDENVDEKGLPDQSRPENKITTATPAAESEDSARLRTLAKKFAELIPEHDFSPADLQDFLLMHKKDAAKAVQSLPEWMEHTHEERQKKEDDKEEDRAARRNAKRQKMRQFRAEIKRAVKDEDADKTDEEGEKNSTVEANEATGVADDKSGDAAGLEKTEKSIDTGTESARETTSTPQAS